MFKTTTAKLMAAATVTMTTLPFMAEATLASKSNFQVKNDTRYDIVALYISESTFSTWQRSIGQIRRGNSASITFGNQSRSACLYDLRAVFSDGTVHTKYKLNVCQYDSYRIYD